MSGASAGMPGMLAGSSCGSPASVQRSLQRQLGSKGECSKRTEPQALIKDSLPFANVLLVKTSHVAKSRVSVGGTTQVCEHQEA